MENKIKWGIIGTGHISKKFADALAFLPEAELAAVASKDMSTANEFAANRNIPRAYGSYEELADDPDIDVIYIGTPHTFHLENSVLCMRKGKAVMCEKAFAINAAKAKEMVRLAREENVFLMEAMIKIDDVFAVPTKASLFINKKEVEVLEESTIGNTLNYEADEVMRCMKTGLKESPFMPLEESILIMEIMDKIRKPWGLVYPNDNMKLTGSM